MGSAIFVSSAVLHIRKRYFEGRLEELAERKRRRLGPLRTLTFSLTKRRPANKDEHEEAVASGVLRGSVIHEEDPDRDYEPTFAVMSRTGTGDGTTDEIADDTLEQENTTNRDGPHIAFGDDVRPLQDTGGPVRPRPRMNSQSFFSNTGVAARGFDNHPRNAKPIHNDIGRESNTMEQKPRPSSLAKVSKYMDTINGFVGRNSQFHHLSEKERRILGGIEYDAICLLSYLVPLYFVLFQLLGAVGMGAWMQINRPSVALRNGENSFWTGCFFAVSAFNNSGMALLDANAVALQTSYYGLLTLSLLILAGNTCFPPFLRLSVWTLKHCIPESASPKLKKWKTVLNFILEHPRRVYTNLFPARQTWWLVFSLFLLNGLDWIAFEILNIGNPALDHIAPRFRVLDGLFQAFAVRSGGFYVVSISELYPGLLVLYVLMMYVSTFPVTMSIRNTNVYEERSLGIFGDESDAQPPDTEKQTENLGKGFRLGLRRTMTMAHGGNKAPARTSTWTNQDFVRQQLRGQLGHDLWWIALAVFFISIVETHQFKTDPVNFSIFNILFEIVSAYGCVGISIGVPGNAYSFSGAWQTTSKLILCAVMLRGRHRGLPVAIDRAILLPSESLAWAEEEDAHKRMRVKTRTNELGAAAERRKTENGDVV